MAPRIMKNARDPKHRIWSPKDGYIVLVGEIIKDAYKQDPWWFMSPYARIWFSIGGIPHMLPDVFKEACVDYRKTHKSFKQPNFVELSERDYFELRKFLKRGTKRVLSLSFEEAIMDESYYCTSRTAGN